MTKLKRGITDVKGLAHQDQRAYQDQLRRPQPPISGVVEITDAKGTRHVSRAVFSAMNGRDGDFQTWTDADGVMRIESEHQKSAPVEQPVPAWDFGAAGKWREEVTAAGQRELVNVQTGERRAYVSIRSPDPAPQRAIIADGADSPYGW